jgi:hypothetical protein
MVVPLHAKESIREHNYTESSKLLDALADAYLRAEILASRSPEYEALAEAVGYALDLADMALVAEAGVADELEPWGAP